MNEHAADTIRSLEWLSLVAALTPFAVAVIRAAVKDWIPVGDATYFTVRSVDVLTEHHPLLGAWSSGSSIVGVPVNNLGPLQLDVLAPFTKVSPYLGTAIGSALINAVSIVVVWIVARRMFRPSVVVAVMVGTTLFVASLGLSWLIDARQQQAMVLPLYALLWVSAAMWAGVPIAVPISVVIGSLIVQTHFTYAYGAVLVIVAGIVGFGLATWTTRDQWKRTVGWSVLLGAVVLDATADRPILGHGQSRDGTRSGSGPSRSRARHRHPSRRRRGAGAAVLVAGLDAHVPPAAMTASACSGPRSSRCCGLSPLAE